ncbi:cytochrome P450 [Nocardia niigatensis]|uniref:cytochrome P450 n=1 Tax=Nocardia niigatensis TaxID=209249 RepID=UPI0002E8864C|nr:cytochrome P450 [Nocardia niigatensis]
MEPNVNGEREFDPVNVSSRAFWALSPQERDKSFADLRRRSPVSWQPPVDSVIAVPEIPGYWAVVTHDLIRQVSMDAETYCSGEGVQLEDIPSDVLEAASSFLAMDGERHQRLRKLMSSAFTPRQVTKIEDRIRDRAITIVDDFLVVREGDFVEHVSKQMPMNTFYDIAGLPPEYRDEAAHHADVLAGWNDPDITQGREPGEVMSEALVGNLTLGLQFAEMTKQCPRDDVWTNLVQAEVDGRPLTEDELASMFVLMSFAGNDTTRSTISLGTKVFLENRDQLAYLMEDFEGRIDAAVEEVVRWVTPVMTFRRTATRDTVLGGQQIRKGDWVVMFYSSGNRDETVFDNPWQFDISRNPNGHVGFGGGGPHFCLGSFLARKMLRHMFDQLFHRIPNLELGEPELLVGNFAGAVKGMRASTGCPIAH